MLLMHIFCISVFLINILCTVSQKEIKLLLCECERLIIVTMVTTVSTVCKPFHIEIEKESVSNCRFVASYFFQFTFLAYSNN